MQERHIFNLGKFQLQKGITVPDAFLAYKTYGTLNADKSNVILYPNSFAFTDEDTDWLIKPDKILDPTKYFIIIPNMFGNGMSSSPSNFSEPLGKGQNPLITHVDNITAQHRLLTEIFNINKIALVYGWSMGAQQALHWAAFYPDQVERVCAICGTAKTSPHNQVFVESVIATLTTDPAYKNGTFHDRPTKGLRAMGRVYAGWAMSQAFYRDEIYKQAGYASMDDFIINLWEANFLKRDAENLISMMKTWLASDISDNDIYSGDLDLALRSIKAKTFLISSNTDLYFTSYDIQSQAEKIPDATFYEMESLWGHRAGNPSQNKVDEDFIRHKVKELLV